MAGFRIGSTEPVSGKVKVGSSDVSKIYQGTTLVWPPSTSSTDCGSDTVIIDDLCWTTVNEDTTSTSTSATVTIATTQSQLVSYNNSSTPAACYWNFDSANSARGLYYNRHAAAILSPPSGYRMPTYGDWGALVADVKDPNINFECTALGADPGGWSTAVQNNSRLGSSGFNGNAYGYVISAFSYPFTSGGKDVGYWFSQALDSTSNFFEDAFAFGEQFSGTVSLGYLKSFRQSNSNKYTLIRWVKDV